MKLFLQWGRTESIATSIAYSSNNTPAPQEYDVVILGAGVSGSIWAHYAVQKKLSTLVIEAGEFYSQPSLYPKGEVNGNCELYWNGGAELNTEANIGFLRPRVVGGGSVVNQALLDRFDGHVWESWKKETGLDFESQFKMDQSYEQAESFLEKRTLGAELRNKNANLFIEGCEKNGYQYSALTRAQKDCDNVNENDCINCLNGCTKNSKQSFDRVFFDKLATSAFLHLCTNTQAHSFKKIDAQTLEVTFQNSLGVPQVARTKKLVLAMGAIGNSIFLLKSKLKDKLPALGEYFFTHPQFMTIGVYSQPIHAEKGAFQTVKSSDPLFREQGFKLENVFAPPVALAMLIPETGAKHFEIMSKISQMACIEVAIRDENPGSISISSSGKLKIRKTLDSRDEKKKSSGLRAINNIYKSTQAQQIIQGKFGIGLHLMGGCRLGSDIKTSLINSDFSLHGHNNIFCSDSSVFPLAPGINPSLSIMAFSHFAAREVLAV